MTIEPYLRQKALALSTSFLDHCIFLPFCLEGSVVRRKVKNALVGQRTFGPDLGHFREVCLENQDHASPLLRKFQQTATP